jgi:aryl-alcohol dehydrogenase-like predicted oxidoreductase
MRYGTIAGLERPASRVVLGTMALTTKDQGLADAILDAFVARGGNLIDTAQVYMGGSTERAVGDWMRRRGNRGDVMILTKGGHHASDGTRRVNAHEIAFDIGGSLERLGTRYADLYLLHRDDPAVPAGEIVDILHHHAAAGRLRAYGGSNWTHERLEAANAYATQRGVAAFAASSPNLSLAVPNEPMWRDVVSISGDAAALEWYRRTQLPILPWSSQGGGFFSGRFSPDKTDDANVARVYYSDGNWERLRRAESLGREIGLSAIQVALAWVLNAPGLNTFPLIGPRTPAELESSLAAADVALAPEQAAWLNLEARHAA